MINYNGVIVSPEKANLSIKNRGFKYGDAIFETIKVLNNSVVFWEDHYFRLMASMRMLRMHIPMSFTLEFLEQEILKTIPVKNSSNTVRVRLDVFRKDGGLYLPSTNDIDYLIEAKEYDHKPATTYVLDVYKDFYNYSGLLSSIKTNNRMVNTLASIFAAENGLDNCVLLNERKGVAEVSNGNIFIVVGNIIKTPSISEGCINGVTRKKVIDIISKDKTYEIVEGVISPFEIQRADEVFITNAIIGIQSVTQYKKKRFDTKLSDKLQQTLKILQLTGG